MATQNIHGFDPIKSALLAAYAHNHAENVRDLAEVIDLATAGGSNELSDEEDRRCGAFRQCIELYALREGISLERLSDAVVEWQSIPL